MFREPGEVIAAFLRGSITEQQATSILTTQFRWSPSTVGPTLRIYEANPQSILAQYPASTTGGGVSSRTAQATPYRTAESQGFAEENPQAFYRNLRGIPGQGASDFQSWMAAQYAPTFGTYQASEALSPAGATSPGFGGFMGAGRNPFETRALAGQLFNQAQSPSSGIPGGQQGFVERMGENLASFIQNVLRNRYGAEMARGMGQNLGGLQAQYAGETLGQGTNFLDFLRQQYRI